MSRITAIAVAALAFACGSNSAPVSFSVTTARAASASQALVVASGIDIQRIRLNVGGLKLEGAESAGTSASAVLPQDHGSDDGDGGVEHEDGEVEFRAGPFVIDLDTTALTGSVTKVFDASVPAGTYHEFRFQVLPGAGLQNSSVIVEGTIDGQSFTFTSALRASQKKEGSFVVGDGTANITLSFDPANWFGAASGRLDPRDPLNRGAIEGRIAASLDVFQDDDHSGHENHHGEDGGHH
jgi:hypothetical protein